MKSDIKYCRTCYGHLAGETGVKITGQLIHKKYIELQKDTFKVTDSGRRFFEGFNINTEHLKSQKKIFSKACLDGSEHKYHLGGSLGTSLFQSMINKKWFEKKKDSRALIISSQGKKALNELFEIND